MERKENIEFLKELRGDMLGDTHNLSDKVKVARELYSTIVDLQNFMEYYELEPIESSIRMNLVYGPDEDGFYKSDDGTKGKTEFLSEDGFETAYLKLSVDKDLFGEQVLRELNVPLVQKADRWVVDIINIDVKSTTDFINFTKA